MGQNAKKAPTLRQDYAPSVLVSKSIAQQLFPRQDTVNGHIMWTDSLIKYADLSPAPRRIVGVSADVDDANIIPQRNRTIYQPFAQGPLFGARLVVRTKRIPTRSSRPLPKPFVPRLPRSPWSTQSTLEEVPTSGTAAGGVRRRSGRTANSPPGRLRSTP